MELNRKGRRTLSSNKLNKNNKMKATMEVTNEQKLAYEQIVKIMQDNNLGFNVQHQVVVVPNQPVVQTAPKEETPKVVDIE
jgi:hypothetical protein